MSKIIFGFILIFLAGICQADEVSSADAAKMSRVADSIVTNAEINAIGARGAAQVSQIADQAQLQLARIIVKQNDEMISLLREIAKKK